MVIKWPGFPLIPRKYGCPRGLRSLSSEIGVSCNLRNHDGNPAEDGILSTSETSPDSADFIQGFPRPDRKSIVEIAKEVSKFIGTNTGWEEKLLGSFPAVSFVDPFVYKEVLRSESNLSLSLRFYYWLTSLNGFIFDPVLYNMMFSRLVKANDVHAAKTLLDDTCFEPEPKNLEPYVLSLFKAGCFKEALLRTKRLRMAGHCISHSTWNLALASTSKARRGDVMCKLQDEMMACGVQTDMSTIGSRILALCAESKADKAYVLLRQSMDAGHFPDTVFLNRLISSLCMSGDFGNASAVLHHMIAKNRNPGIYTYQAIIHELCKQGRTLDGFLIFNELKRRGHSPDTVMYTTMIHSLCKEQNVGDAQQLWREMVSKGITVNKHTCCALLDGLWKNGCIHEAENLHKEMLDRGYGEDTVTFNTMISGLCFNRKVEEAGLLFKEMAEKGIARDRITFSVLINAYMQKRDTMQVMFVLYESLKQGIKPSTSSLVQLITKLCEDGCVEEANTLWKDMLNMGLQPPYLCLEPIVCELGKQKKFSRAMECLCYMINSGFTPRKALLGLVQAPSLSVWLDYALFIHSYVLKTGFLLEENTSHDLVDNYRCDQLL